MTPKQHLVEQYQQTIKMLESREYNCKESIRTAQEALLDEQQKLRQAKRALLWAESLPDFDPTVEPPPQRGREFI